MGLFDFIKKKKDDDDEQQEDQPFRIQESRIKDDSQLVDLGVIQDFATSVAPTALTNKDTYIKVGNEFMRSIYVYDYPPDLEIGWMEELITLSESIDFSLHIQPVPVDLFLEIVDDRVGKDGAVLARMREDQEPTDFELQQRYEDNKSLSEMLQRRETKPFQIALIVTARAPTLKALDALTNRLETQIMKPATTRTPDLRHHDGFISTLPAQQNNLADGFTTQIVHTLGMLAFFPFTNSELTHETGVMMGINQQTLSNVIIDRFNHHLVPNANMAIFGASGSGKSYLAKSEALQWSLLGVPVLVIDPQEEYTRLANALGGQVIGMGISGKNKINPLDFSHSIDPRSQHDPAVAEAQGNVLAVKIDNVITQISIMLAAGRGGGTSLNNRQEVILELALRQLYKQFGYDLQSLKDQSRATPDVMPILSDLYSTLERLSRRRPGDRTFQEDMEGLLIGLTPYVGTGSLAPLFDTKTNVELNSDFIVFNILDVTKRNMPAVMQLILEYLTSTLYTQRQKESGVKRMLCIDESHRLMEFPQTAKFMEISAREARKFGVGFTVINQDTDKFLILDDGKSINVAGRNILANCASRVLLKQTESNIDVIQKVFKLNDTEATKLVGAGTGEGLLYVDQERAWLSSYGIMSPAAHQLLKTEAGSGGRS